MSKQGLAFRGHFEQEDSKNRGNFKEMVDFLGEFNFQKSLLDKFDIEKTVDQYLDVFNEILKVFIFLYEIAYQIYNYAQK